MKKFLFSILFIIVLLSSEVNATTVKVIALDHFSTLSPSTSFDIQISETQYLKNGIFLERGTVLSGQVIKVYRPKAGKRDSSFEFRPTLLTYNGKTTNISHSKMVASVVAYKPIDPKKLAGNVAIKSANFVILGSSQAISFTMGATQAPKGTKIVSGLNRMYSDSFISLLEAGKELDINKGDILILKIKD